MNLPAELVADILSYIELEQLFTLSFVNGVFNNECKRIVNVTIEYHLYDCDTEISDSIKSKTWYDKKGHKRKIEYNEGNKIEEVWTKNNLLHRIKGPAEQEWYQNGQLKWRGWYQNGMLYKTHGTPWEMWSINGECEYQVGPHKPKIPLNSYMLFVTDYRRNHQEKLSKIKTITEQGKYLGEKYRDLDETHREKYITKANENGFKFNKALKAYYAYNHIQIRSSPIIFSAID